jgi:hypothetical protein
MISLIVLLGLGCNDSPKNSSGKNPEIEFSQTDFDFGEIKQGERVAHRFIFKNTGDGDLLIKNVVAGCGCTVASFPKEPLEPGDESFIEATFNSEGYRGIVVKDVEVYSNADHAKIKLTISAEVIPEN